PIPNKTLMLLSVQSKIPPGRMGHLRTNLKPNEYPGTNSMAKTVVQVFDSDLNCSRNVIL
ncbi:MAG: hypothetical protein ACKVHR_18030, partial [Pirellulales bacterium]